MRRYLDSTWKVKVIMIKKFPGCKVIALHPVAEPVDLVGEEFLWSLNDSDKNDEEDDDHNCVQISTFATLLMKWWWWNRCYTFFITRAQFVGLRSWTLILWSPVKVVFPTYWYIIYEISPPIDISSLEYHHLFKYHHLLMIDISVSKYHHLYWCIDFKISPPSEISSLNIAMNDVAKKSLKLMFTNIEARLIFHTLPDIKLCSNSHQTKVAIRNQRWKSFGDKTMI